MKMTMAVARAVNTLKKTAKPSRTTIPSKSPIPSPAGGGIGLFEGMVVLDGFAVFFKVLTALATAIVIFMSIDCYELTDRTQAEYYLFLLSVLLGMFLLSSASDLVMLYLALELVSIPSYLLAAYPE